MERRASRQSRVEVEKAVADAREVVHPLRVRPRRLSDPPSLRCRGDEWLESCTEVVARRADDRDPDTECVLGASLGLGVFDRLGEPDFFGRFFMLTQMRLSA